MIQFKKQYGVYAPGDEANLGMGVETLLIQRGIAEEAAQAQGGTKHVARPQATKHVAGPRNTKRSSQSK